MSCFRHTTDGLRLEQPKHTNTTTRMFFWEEPSQTELLAIQPTVENSTKHLLEQKFKKTRGSWERNQEHKSRSLEGVRDNTGVWIFLKCQAIRHLRCFSKSIPLGSLPSLPLVSPWKFSNLVHIAYPALSTQSGDGRMFFLVPTDSQREQKQEAPVHSSHRGSNKPLQCLWHFLLCLLIIISNPGKRLASSHLTDKKTEAQKG